MDSSKFHLSIRVPWHDTGWEGRVCQNPRLNGACLALNRIAIERNDDAEEDVAGLSISELEQEEWPCCVAERAAFMTPFEYVRIASHPYRRTSEESHGHFEPTALRHPRYSAPAVPFKWMLKEFLEEHAETYGLDVNEEREKQLKFDTVWIQEKRNQEALLDGFFNQIELENSLCFFYAKQVPFIEESKPRRILIGVGRVLHVAPSVEYNYNTKNLVGKIRSVLWERMVQHSIRPDFEDGFILPYHEAIKMSKSDSGIGPEDIVAFTPEDRILEFSHVTQHVSHDGAIASLLSLANSLRIAREKNIPGSWDGCLQWVDDRINEIWRFRGPCPGLGSALSAFGLKYGTLIARKVFEKAEENTDPWPIVDEVFENPQKFLPDNYAKSFSESMRIKWNELPDERRNLLKLISRLMITSEQATQIYVKQEREEMGIFCSDQDILTNPYIMYEKTRLNQNPISVWTVDRGVFPDDVIQNEHPLPSPTRIDDGTDFRRVRALSVNILEDAAIAGNTLMPQTDVVRTIRRLNVRPECLIDDDLINSAQTRGFDDEIQIKKMADEKPSFQLNRLSEVGKTIVRSVKKRINAGLLDVEADWRRLLDEHLDEQGVKVIENEEEEKARTEKSKALKVLAESRFSVLIGPAGTGKTTLLSVLCSHPQIEEEGVILLAPTGKARVKMEQAISNPDIRGYTIAQFLIPERYDSSTGRYKLSSTKTDVHAGTVVVDEASMLTEEMLAALISSLRGTKRLILIGDPRQLPPIGAGRPFVDIIRHLKPDSFENKTIKVGPNIAELTTILRQAGENREDRHFAALFSGNQVPTGEDLIFNKTIQNTADNIRFVEWTDPDELNEKILSTLMKELGLESKDDIEKFNESLGAIQSNGYSYFNVGCAKNSESWQILTPVRNLVHGASEINRLLHKQFRQPQIDESRRDRFRKFTKPMGPEEIVYGDKVINVVNTDPNNYIYRHRRVYPEDRQNPFVANGEIGMVVGYFRRKNTPDFRWKMEVEFSSQPNYKYDFTARDFGEESNPILELAYALTVHKSQGSEFETIILVLPNPCRLLSRELLYTALTRQRQRVIILHQGSSSNLFKYTKDDYSETASRLTNLFELPSPVIVKKKMFEENLIHRTMNDDLVRSKSELIIADKLNAKGLDYTYELPLKIGEDTKYPDFTIEDESGITYYWEHCGMMHDTGYLRRWEEKKKWYTRNEILPYEDGGGKNGTLIVSTETPEGGFSSKRIDEIIEDIFMI